MCGFIVAISNNQAIDRDTFEIARDTMHHRGPDASGSQFFERDRVALGHRRLSIIDLTEAGNQPMQLDSLWVVFNGEIYNFPALRKELIGLGCHFKSHSDTEVLLNGYKIWGKDLCDHLEGMFSFALYDQSSGKVFVARDHVGQKPLYYAVLNGFFIAASEIKAIHSFFGQSFAVRRESMLDFLVYDYVPDPHTWYQDVYSLMPGSFLEVDRENGISQLKESVYWTYAPPVEPDPVSSEDALALIDQEIRRSVRCHMLADVDVGALLSGGVDSGSIVSVASEFSESPLQTFTIGFGSKDEDELPAARMVANKYGTLHTEKIVGEAEFLASIEEVLNIFDQPFADSSLVPTRAVCAIASESVKVVLTGDGGDETFGGYNLGTYISPFLNRDLLRRIGVNRQTANYLFQVFKDMVSYFAMSQHQWNAREHYPRYQPTARRELRVLSRDLRRDLESYEYGWMYPNNTVSGLDAFRQAQWHHIKNILPGKMLVKIDRCSMEHSIEARAPFLSHRLIEAMMNLPTAVKNPREDWYKGLLRTWASDRLPHAVLHAPKRGFAVPGAWNTLSNLSGGIENVRRCVDAGFISPNAWPELRRKRYLLWRVLQVEHAIDIGLLS